MTESGLAFGFMLFLLFLAGAVIGGWVMLFLLQRDMAELRAGLNVLKHEVSHPSPTPMSWVPATTAGRVPSHPHSTIYAERVERPPRAVDGPPPSAPFVAVPDAVPPAPEERIAHEVSEEAIRGLTEALLKDAQEQGISMSVAMARENAREMLQTGDLGPTVL